MAEEDAHNMIGDTVATYFSTLFGPEADRTAAAGKLSEAVPRLDHCSRIFTTGQTEDDVM